MSIITSNLYVYVSAFLHCYCITKAFNFPISELCRCWGSDREEGEDCPFCCGNEKRLRQAGNQAGRLDRGWADDSILYRSTPDRLHQIHRWWSSPRCRVIILLPPFRTSTARHMFWKSLIVNQSTWTVFFGFVWVCVCVCVFSLGCPLFIFCEYWAVGSRWSLFSRKSEQEWTDYAASLVNTRNGCNWTKVANPGSFLDSIFAVLMAKHLPNLGLTHLQVGALSR